MVGGLAACASTHGGSGDAAGAAESSTSQAPAGHTRTFIATDIDGNHATIDLGTKSQGEPDIGDLVAFTQNLTENGKAVGQVHVISTFVDHEKHLAEATGTIELKEGSVQLAGIVAMGPNFTLSVTGGTGHYVGATGTMVFDGSGNDQVMKVTLR